MEFVVLQGMFFDDKGHSKSRQMRIVSRNEYLFYYDGSYECLYMGSKEDCEQFIKH